jgi:hypothetical protein
MSKPTQEPIKDEEKQHPVARIWRPSLRDVVKAFVQGDYAIAQPIRFVAPVGKATVKQIKAYIAEYGETLAELPNETWKTSVSQWMGTHWEVLVDLWTEESGASDLVLSARVFEAEEGYKIKIDSVHVP